MLPRVIILVAFLAIVGVPLFARLASPAPKPPRNVRTLVVITPHVPQIRTEFGEAFARWHLDNFQESVHVDWRAPGGTSEILKLLSSQFDAASSQGKVDWSDPKDPAIPAGTIAYDLMFGGGSFDHTRLKNGIKVQRTVDGKPTESTLPMSRPAGFSPEQMKEWFDHNIVGAQELADKDQFWLGTALSSFGIVYNRDVLTKLGVPPPQGFEGLTDPRLAGTIILTDPRQSGSVTTALDAGLNAAIWNRAASEGWNQQLKDALLASRKDRLPWFGKLQPQQQASAEAAFREGWRMLLDIGANSRTFTAAATKPPVDVSAGEGSMGLTIDFYGRGQAQSVGTMQNGVFVSRVEYVDPAGATYIDADPASILRGGPNPDLAKRFVEFCMTDEAQALWNFPSQADPRFATNPKLPDGRTMGPRLYELRRMPVKPSFYRQYSKHLIDQVDPFSLAAPHLPVGWRDAIGVVMGAASIDNASFQRDAWKALRSIREGGNAEKIKTAQSLWEAMPPTTIEAVPGSQEQTLDFSAANFAKIAAAYRTGQRPRIEIAYTTFFRENYQRIIALADD
jgi:iron(III) transport system substrate-binding protein